MTPVLLTEKLNYEFLKCSHLDAYESQDVLVEFQDLL